MAERMHKHKGILRSDTGVMRNHPVTQKHKDKNIQKYHNLELANFAKSNKKIPTIGSKNLGTKKATSSKKKDMLPLKEKMNKIFKSEEKTPDVIGCPIDNDGYISIDIDSLKVKGVRISCIKSNYTKVSNIQQNDNTIGIEITK